MRAATESLRINADRMKAAFDSLARFGAAGDGGVNRPTFSEAHDLRSLGGAAQAIPRANSRNGTIA